MKMLETPYLALFIVLGGVTITTVLAETDTNITTYPYVVTDGSNPRLLIDNTGNVGIGTSSPAQKLDVNGIIQTEGLRFVINGFDGSPGNFWFKTAGNEPSSVFMGLTDTNTGAAGAVIIAPGSTLGIYVPNTGNVGIGTSSPAQKLDVNGNIRLTGNVVSPNDICVGTC